MLAEDFSTWLFGSSSELRNAYPGPLFRGLGRPLIQQRLQHPVAAGITFDLPAGTVVWSGFTVPNCY
jgi:hypothetical protein